MTAPGVRARGGAPAAARGPHHPCPRGSQANLRTRGAREGGRDEGIRSARRLAPVPVTGRKAGPPGSPRAPRRGSQGIAGAGPSSAGGAGPRRGRGLGPPLPAGPELPASPSWRDEGNLRNACGSPALKSEVKFRAFVLLLLPKDCDPKGPPPVSVRSRGARAGGLGAEGVRPGFGAPSAASAAARPVSLRAGVRSQCPRQVEGVGSLPLAVARWVSVTRPGRRGSPRQGETRSPRPGRVKGTRLPGCPHSRD